MFVNIIIICCFTCTTIFYLFIKIASVCFNVKILSESYFYLSISIYVLNIILVAILSRILYISSQLKLANIIDLISNIILIISLFYFKTIMDLKLFITISVIYSLILWILTLRFLLKLHISNLNNLSRILLNVVIVYCCNALLLKVVDIHILLGFFLIVNALMTILKFYPITRWLKHIVLQLNAAK